MEPSDPRVRTALERPRSVEPRWRAVWYFLLLLVALQLLVGGKIRLSQWSVNARDNASVAEGVAWLHGQVSLLRTADGPEPQKRPHDTAYYNGKVYCVYPPLVPILTVLLAPLHSLRHLPEGVWARLPYMLLCFWPLPIVGYLVFRRQAGESAWGALLTLAWIGGTTVLPMLEAAQHGYLAQLYHAMSQVGLLIFAADMLGRRRLWPGLLGLLISTYTRQLTFLFALPLLWVAWHQGRRRLALTTAGLLAIAAPLLILNYLKFGNPLDFGYRHVYVGREVGDYMGERAKQYGLFSPHFIPENFYYLNLAPPAVGLDPPRIEVDESNHNGVSLWLTTPIAAWVFLGAREWWRDSRRRLLMLATVPVLAALLCYHSPGYMQPGFNRFALDFLPIWLVVVAPWTRGGWRTHFTLGCIAWGLLYFQAIVPDTPIS